MFATFPGKGPTFQAGASTPGPVRGGVVPEISVDAMGAALTLLIGLTLIFFDRRRRHAKESVAAA